MNPKGQIYDIYSLQESINTQTGLLSPDKCAELVTALNTQKGKGKGYDLLQSLMSNTQ